MKITTQLLKKYIRESCTYEEELVVKSWLESYDEEKSVLSLDELASIKSEIWNNISIDFPEKNSKIISLCKKAFPYAVAASLLLIVLFNQNSNFLTEKDSLSQLQITSGKGRIVNVNNDKLRINFDGYLQLINKSSMPKTIISGDKAIKIFQLEPETTYYLEKIKGIPYIVNENNLPLNEDFSRYLRGHFSISLTAS